MTMPNPQQMIINGGFKLGKSSMLSIRYLSLRERRFAVFFLVACQLGQRPLFSFGLFMVGSCTTCGPEIWQSSVMMDFPATFDWRLKPCLPPKQHWEPFGQRCAVVQSPRWYLWLRPGAANQAEGHQKVIGSEGDPQLMDNDPKYIG